MSAENLNFSVDSTQTSIVLQTNELSVTPTAIDMSLTVASPGPANLSFQVSPASANVVVNQNTIALSPSAVNMQVYGGGFAVAGGTSGTVQFNNSGVLGGMPNVTYSGGTLSLGNVANVKLAGGNANSVLRTDGNGNLSWGGPVVAGGNNQIQFNSNGSIAGSVNLTYQAVNQFLSVPNVAITNAYIGNYFYSNGQPLNLSNTYSNANVAAFFANYTLFTGVVNDLKSPGSTYTTSATSYSGREAYMKINSPFIVNNFCSDGTYIYGLYQGDIVRSTDGQNWSSVYTWGNGFTMAYNGTYFVAVSATGTIRYSTDGTTWGTSNVTSTTKAITKIIAFGTLFITCGTSGIYTATNPTAAANWTLRNSTSLLGIAASSSTVVAYTATAGIYSSNGTTWTNITASTFVSARYIAASPSTLIISGGSGISPTYYRSTNGSAWTSFTVSVGQTQSSTMNYNTSTSVWYIHDKTPLNPNYPDIATTDFTNYYYRNVSYMGTVPDEIVEDFNIGSINLIVSSADTAQLQYAVTMRKIPQNLIYTDIRTMNTAPVGNYICLGSTTLDYQNSSYMWIATT